MADRAVGIRAEERARLVRSLARQLGSVREAGWIVDHAGVDGAQALADRRVAGEPLQYVLGQWPFRSLELMVDARVLVPRPETEQVVEVALQLLEAQTGPSEGRVGVDLGTGSGAIALALATEGARADRPLEVWATDRSVEALAVAGENVRRVGLVDPAAAARVHLAEGSWFEALPPALLGRVDLLVSNPPYVGESEYPELDPTVRDWEPEEALVAARGAGGVEGTAAIETIVAGAERWLRPTGALVIEIAPSQAVWAGARAREAGFTRVGVERDLAGRLRMLVARW